MARNRKKKVDYRNRSTNRQGPRSQRGNQATHHNTHADARGGELMPTVSEAGMLRTPPAPKGIKYHWISRDVLGVRSTSYDRRMAEGWKPVRPEDLPTGHSLPIEKLSGLGSVLAFRGDVLCQMSEAQWRVNQLYWEKKAEKETVEIANKGRRALGDYNAPVEPGMANSHNYREMDVEEAKRERDYAMQSANVQF